MPIKRSHSPFKNNIRPFLIGIIFGAGVSVLLLIIFALLMSSLELSEGIDKTFSSVSLGAGCFVNGYISCRIFRHNGLLKGLQCGLIAFLLCFLISFFIGAISGAMLFTKLLICLICGGVGGIFGVNAKVKI